MKKILLVFDGTHFSKGAFDLACRIREKEPILLTGIFLPPVDYAEVMMYYVGGMTGVMTDLPYETDREEIEKNISLFKELCVKNDIEHTVHPDIMGSVVDNIAKETRYADLLLIGSERFYSNLTEGSRERYLKQTIHEAECPIVLAPEECKIPDRLILAYDGSASAMLAIKFLIYLFPEWTKLSTMVVYTSLTDKEIPDLSYMEEFAGRHFPDLSFYKLAIDAKKYFATWTNNRRTSLLVAGGFGRSSWSELFRHNFLEEIISAHQLPVFIAHK